MSHAAFSHPEAHEADCVCVACERDRIGAKPAFGQFKKAQRPHGKARIRGFAFSCENVTPEQAHSLFEALHRAIDGEAGR